MFFVAALIHPCRFSSFFLKIQHVLASVDLAYQTSMNMDMRHEQTGMASKHKHTAPTIIVIRIIVLIVSSIDNSNIIIVQ